MTGEESEKRQSQLISRRNAYDFLVKASILVVWPGLMILAAEIAKLYFSGTTLFGAVVVGIIAASGLGHVLTELLKARRDSVTNNEGTA